MQSGLHRHRSEREMDNSKTRKNPDGSPSSSSTGKVNLSSLRAFVTEKFSSDSILREVILTEADLLSSEDFIVKAEMWLKLLRSERDRD